MKRHSLLCIGCVVVMFASCKKEEAAPTPTPTPTQKAPATPPNVGSGLGGMYNISSSTNPGGGGGYTGVVTIAGTTPRYVASEDLK